HRDVQAGRAGELRTGEHVHGIRDVLGHDLALEDGAVRVELAEILFGDAVGRGTVRAPSGGEDPGAAHHAVGVDAVHADAELAQLHGQQAHLVGLVGLRGGVGDVVRAGEDRVLRGDVD